MPVSWYVGRVCEEFGCVPSVALREIETFADGFLDDVIEARAFAASVRAVKQAGSKADIPDTPLCQLAVAIELEEAGRALAAMKNGG